MSKDKKPTKLLPLSARPLKLRRTADFSLREGEGEKVDGKQIYDLEIAVSLLHIPGPKQSHMATWSSKEGCKMGSQAALSVKAWREL